MFEDFDLGGNGEAVAQPQDNNTDFDGGTADGANNQEDGTLASGNRENVADSSEDTANNNAQSQEDNARFAAARREAEAETRAMKNRMTALAKSHGFNTFDEFEQHLNETKLKEIGQKLYDNYGADPEEVKPLLDDMINNHPDVIKARQAAELAHQQEAQRYVESEIAKVKELNPDIKSFEDIMGLDNFSDIEALLNRNYSISDAYKIANFNSIMESSSKRSAQEVRNSIESKSHLAPTKGAGAGDAVMVPEDIKEQYKIFNPGITDDEIAKDYKKSLERK